MFYRHVSMSKNDILHLPHYILDQISDAVIVYDRNWKFVYMNKAAADLTGKNPQEVIGKTVWETSPESMKTESGEKFLEAARTGKFVSFKTFYPPLGRWFDVQIYPGKDTIITTFRDITQQINIEKALNTSKDQLNAIIHSINDAIIVQDSKGKIIFANEAGMQITSDKIVGTKDKLTYKAYENRYEVFDEDGEPFPFSKFPGRRAIAGEKYPSVTLKFIDKKTKDVRWATIKSTAICDSEGVPEMVVNVISDITGIKKAEKALQESKIQLDAVFQLLPIGIGLSDAKGNYLLSNKVMKQYIPTNLLPSQDDNLYWRWEAYYPDGTRVDRQDFPGARALRGENVVPGMEMLYTHDDGTKEWTRVAAIPLKDHRGKVIGQVAIVENINEQKRDEQRKDDFIAMASHELKTPLTSTKILTHVLLRQFKNNSKAIKMLAKMDDQIDKLSRLVGELLDVTRIGKGQLEMKNEVFLVKSVVDDVIEEVQPTTDHKLVIDWHARSFVDVDKRRLRQVLVNFITNAIKFSPNKKNIIIFSLREGKSIVVGVRDFGIGIPKEDQPHLFERFYQVTKDNRNTYPGLGIGLFIAKEMIIRMDGKVWCTSEEGKGSTFYFSLPIYKK